MVIIQGYCDNCGEKYTDIYNNWCKPCQIDYLKKKLTSGNKKIDNFIQEMQLKIDRYNDIIFEWIPYNQFNKIKEIGKGGFATVYSAKWKDGPLYYNNKKLRRLSANQEFDLKYLFNSQNITNKFLNEV